MAPINMLGEEIETPKVTLPPVVLRTIDDDREI